MEKWLTFDCYGTLVDWRGGMTDALTSVAGPEAEGLLEEYHRHEPDVQIGNPDWSYRAVLAEALRRAADVRGIDLDTDQLDVLGRTLPQWRVFPDTNRALTALRDAGFKLGILSNVDKPSLIRTIEGFDVGIDRVVTSSEIGSYKPALKHFSTFEELTGANKASWIHVACSWFHDVEPAHEYGIRSVYINRERTDHTGGPSSAILPDLVELPEVVAGMFPNVS
ncbi:HAD family hydrolase [Rhodococcus qingshengii]|uniref:HAD family hydrolase n=1 Tax=Rhodococcus qingshengii TaxID=334542 RepID=UPI0036DB2F98